MSDARLDRARGTLPAGYQFGDARWRAPHENASHVLATKAVWGGGYAAWRRDKDARQANYPAERAAWNQAQRHLTANVIEGETDLP
jgi:hypothetical protein